MIKVDPLFDIKLTNFKLINGSFVSSIKQLFDQLQDNEAELQTYLQMFSVGFMVICPTETYHNFRQQLPLLVVQKIAERDGMTQFMTSATLYQWRCSFIMMHTPTMDSRLIISKIFEHFDTFSLKFIYTGYIVKRRKELTALERK